MNKSLFIIFCLQFIFTISFSQDLSRSVISNCGNGGNSTNYYLNYTIGQMATLSGGSNNSISMGFQQGIKTSDILPPEICMVTVDSQTYKYKLIWEQIPRQHIAYYKIYKLIGTSYSQIGTVSYTSLSEFIDFNSSPNNKSERYKISSVDSSNNESALSPYHEIMFLQANQGAQPSDVNLFWGKYVDESSSFIPEWYYVYRGTSPTKMYLLDSVSGGGQPMYTDKNIQSTYYYRVTFEKPSPCISYSNRRAADSSAPYRSSLSNIKPFGTKPYLNVQPSTGIFLKNNDTFEFSVFTNLEDWDLTENLSWLQLNKDTANKLITAIADENTTGKERSGTFTISGLNVDPIIITVIQFSTTSSIETNISDTYINIYPNPFRENTVLEIILPEKASINIQIYDIHGKLTQQISKNEITQGIHQFEIGSEQLKKGIYLLSVEIDKQRIIKKIVKAN